MASTSSIQHSEIYDGESQDARFDLVGHDASPMFRRWKSVIVIDPKPVIIEAQDFQPIRVERTLTAKSVTEPKPGVYVYDFGQNFSGVEQLRGPRGRRVLTCSCASLRL
jgi:alpha-L-rhamnosidase